MHLRRANRHTCVAPTATPVTGSITAPATPARAAAPSACMSTSAAQPGQPRTWTQHARVHLCGPARPASDTNPEGAQTAHPHSRAHDGVAVAAAVSHTGLSKVTDEQGHGRSVLHEPAADELVLPVLCPLLAPSPGCHTLAC
eukprot:232656-Chlamydomonas_euryale.AAC.1